MVSTRTRLNPQTDGWWLELVKPDYIFITPEETYPTEEEILSVPDEDYDAFMDGRRNNRLFRPWQQLFERAEIQFPEGKYRFWLDLAQDLERFGLKWGNRFEGYERQGR